MGSSGQHAFNLQFTFFDNTSLEPLTHCSFLHKPCSQQFLQQLPKKKKVQTMLYQALRKDDSVFVGLLLVLRLQLQYIVLQF